MWNHARYFGAYPGIVQRPKQTPKRRYVDVCTKIRESQFRPRVDIGRQRCVREKHSQSEAGYIGGGASRYDKKTENAGQPGEHAVTMTMMSEKFVSK